MTYRRGKIWWYEFSFEGQRIRESSKSGSKTIAKQAELQRRRELELGINGLAKRERPPLFPQAAKDWFQAKLALSPLGLRYYRQYIRKLSRRFANRLLTDITAEDVTELRRERQAEGLSGRQNQRGSRHLARHPSTLRPMGANRGPRRDAPATVWCRSGAFSGRRRAPSRRHRAKPLAVALPVLRA
jgi:hypothetical protein